MSRTESEATMPVCYNDICANRQLNEVVLMGSHDAAIANGGSNAKTQTKDIYRQAKAGARFFDLRVAAFKTSTLGGKVELRSYHDATKISSPTFRSNDQMKVADLNGAKRSGVKVHTTMLGVAGFGLQGMLQQAMRFLTENGSEFLIFKFDKSENWDLIVEVCRNELTANQGDFLFTTNGTGVQRNLNVRQLHELSGKLLILFPESAFAGFAQPDALHRQGFLKWRNLYSKGSLSAKNYNPNFDGLQYYGKGGVSAGASGDSGKIASNTAIQTNLMQGQGSYKIAQDGWRGKVGMTDTGTQTFGGDNGDAIGLMYWTTTGPSKSGIKKRNDKMWQGTVDSGVRGDMVDLGLQRVDPTPRNLGVGSFGQALKRFMPNIIMVDFVDSAKGNTIKNMNFNSGAVIAQHLQAMG
jgi:hypothetical protein